MDYGDFTDIFLKYAEHGGPAVGVLLPVISILLFNFISKYLFNKYEEYHRKL